ncbi:hypothetical protein AK830_g682 [Neonectria ditissima]|uniref:DUF676 domain-containing protein n=1 Tax=Neonectria ditissima TaxID=78410 RepID=A0A0N8H8Y1_9HYPO|nr:hypothetical protein AK830_g682 [Neonectria ditissima]
MFRPLHPADALRDTNREVNVILVPGVGTPALPAWQNETGRWLENLARDCSDRVQIWTYEYTAVAADRPLIQQLAQEAEKLLDALNKLCTGREAYFMLQHGAASSPPTSMKRRRKPLFFICHSLGGVILKCALSLTKDHIFRHLDVIEAISGFVFLGTPHLPLTIEASPNILELILRSHQKSLPPRNALTVDDNVILAKFCHDFGLLGIQVPIVSAYETVESRVYQGMFAKYRKPRQVPIIFKERCVIGSRNEVIVGVSQDHNSICKVQVGEALYYAIENALQLVLKDAPDLIYGKFHTSSRDAHEMGTVRSQTTDDTRSQAILKTAMKGVPLEVSQSHCSSKDAIFGSSSGCSQGSGNPITTFELQNRNPRLPCFYMTYPQPFTAVFLVLHISLVQAKWLVALERNNVEDTHFIPGVLQLLAKVFCKILPGHLKELFHGSKKPTRSAVSKIQVEETPFDTGRVKYGDFVGVILSQLAKV